MPLHVQYLQKMIGFEGMITAKPCSSACWQNGQIYALHLQQSLFYHVIIKNYQFASWGIVFILRSFLGKLLWGFTVTPSNTSRDAKSFGGHLDMEKEYHCLICGKSMVTCHLMETSILQLICHVALEEKDLFIFTLLAIFFVLML